MSPDEAENLFCFLLFEGLIVFSPMFGSRVLPGGQFIYIHRCQDGNDTGILTVLGRRLHGNHTVGGPSRIEQFVIPHFIVRMQIQVAVLIGSASFLHYQVERKDAVGVFQRTDAGNIGILDATVFIQYLQCPLGMHIGDDEVAFQSLFPVDDNPLYLFVFNDDAGDFTVIEHGPSICPDYID